MTRFMAEKREETELYEEIDEVDDPKTIEIRRVVVQELNRYNDKLSHALDQSLPKFASLMLGRQFITNYVYEKNQTFEAIMHDFKAGLDMLNLEELCDHCSKFLTVLIEVGGPSSQAAERLKRNWNKEVHKKCKITFLPYPQQEISQPVESCTTSNHSQKSSQSDVQLSGYSTPNNVYNSPNISGTSPPHNEHARRFSSTVSTVSQHLKETTDQHFSYTKDIPETTKEPGTTLEDMPLPPVQHHFQPDHVVVSNTASEIKSSRQTDPIDCGHRYSLQETSRLPSSYNEGMLRSYHTTELQQQIDYLKLCREISELKELQTKTAKAQEKLKAKVQKRKEENRYPGTRTNY